MGVPNNGDMHSVWISTASGKVVFKAWMPESIGFSLTNTWVDSFAQSLQEKLNSGVGQVAAAGLNASLGYTPRSQALSALLWQGNASTEFQLPCKIYASASIFDEIITPLKNLIAVSLPTRTEGGSDAVLQQVKNMSTFSDVGGAIAEVAKAPRWFRAPSTPMGRSKGEQRLDLYIGHFMCIKDVVIQDIQFTMPNRLHKSGAPVSCEVTITALTGETPAAEDAINWFYTGPQGVTFSDAKLTGEGGLLDRGVTRSNSGGGGGP